MFMSRDLANAQHNISGLSECDSSLLLCHVINLSLPMEMVENVGFSDIKENGFLIFWKHIH